MESSKVSHWLQIGANLGILAGLILVSVQIFQSNAIAGAELFSDNLESTVARELALVGENPDGAMSRVLFDPDKASPKDYFIADRVYEAILRQLNRAYILSEAGLYGTDERVSPEGFVTINYMMFACPYGLAWLDEVLAPLSAGSMAFEPLTLMRDLASQRLAINSITERMQRAEVIRKELESSYQPFE